MSEFDPNAPDPLDIPLHNFRLVAGTGALLELLLADVESAIVRVFDSRLSEQDKELLKDCRQLRNKVLHCDFRAVKEKLGDMGIAIGSGGVTN